MGTKDFVNPYKFDETLRTRHDGAGTCKGFHQSRHVKSEGPLWIEICLDPSCAQIVVMKCEHQLPASPEDGYVDSINTWNEDGTILTCQYCGADVT